mgnify:CR=1 FL=1
MIQKTLEIKDIASVGEEIGLNLGQSMVDAYQSNNNDANVYLVGKTIIEKILSQPGCQGIEFYDAINEKGQKVLVYVGVDQNGKVIRRRGQFILIR